MFNDRIFNKLFKDLFEFESFHLNHDNFEKRTYSSNDGSINFTYITNKKGKLNDEDEIYLLKQQLDISVENQEFEKAVELRDKIKNLEKNKVKLDKLKKELNECVKVQDFEKSIEIRDQIKSLT
jgi:protein-arginine kinase activator protein McsA